MSSTVAVAVKVVTKVVTKVVEEVVAKAARMMVAERQSFRPKSEERP